MNTERNEDWIGNAIKCIESGDIRLALHLMVKHGGSANCLHLSFRYHYIEQKRLNGTLVSQEYDKHLFAIVYDAIAEIDKLTA